MNWGMADEAADAVLWLHRYGLPGAQLLAQLLTLNDLHPVRTLAPRSLQGDWLASSGRLCPVAAGTALSDSAMRLKDGELIRMVDITHPLLLLPFVANVATAIVDVVVVEWEGLHVTVSCDCLALRGDLDGLLVSCMSEVRCSREQKTLRTSGSAPTMRTPCEMRAKLDKPCWLLLEALAQRTYVPATQISCQPLSR